MEKLNTTISYSFKNSFHHSHGGSLLDIWKFNVWKCLLCIYKSTKKSFPQNRSLKNIYQKQPISFLTYLSRIKIKLSEPFKRQPVEMVKHTPLIDLKFVDELFECGWPLCRIGA